MPIEQIRVTTGRHARPRLGRRDLREPHGGGLRQRGAEGGRRGAPAGRRAGGAHPRGRPRGHRARRRQGRRGRRARQGARASASSPRWRTRCATRSARRRRRRRSTPGASTRRRTCRSRTGRRPASTRSSTTAPSAGSSASGCTRPSSRSTTRPATCASSHYVVGHDCGRIINPIIVEGQMYGGVAQGIGGALYERMAYDENGQLLNASFMDFLMPYATELPEPELFHTETPSPNNVLGVKGVGEAGTIPVAGAIANAISDAIGDPDRPHADLAAADLRARPRRDVRIGIDTGGTFTDVVAVHADGQRGQHQGAVDARRPVGRLHARRSRRPARARSPRSSTGRRSPPTRCSRTTSAASASSPPRASAALLEIGRQSVPDSYGNSYFWVKPDRIVPLHLVQEVERAARPHRRRGARVRRGRRARGRALVPRAGDRLRRRLLPARVHEPRPRAAHARRAGRGAPGLRGLAELGRPARVPRVRALGDHARRRVRQAARGRLRPTRSRRGSTGRSTS